MAGVSDQSHITPKIILFPGETSHMILTERQKDVITEGANIAVGKSASTLSMMIGREIKIDVPVVKLISRDKLVAFFNNRFADEILGVSIDFNGDLSGTSSLFFERHQGKTLVDRLLGDQFGIEDDEWDTPASSPFTALDSEDQLFTDTDKEALIEMGNIMINGLMGTVSNMLNTVFEYSIPELQLYFKFESLSEQNSTEEELHALLLETHFRDKEAEIEGFLTLIFEFGEQTNRFIQAIDKVAEAIAIDGGDEF